MDASAPTSHPVPLPVVDFSEDAATSPVLFRECVAVAVLVVLCDLTIYRGGGFAGYGLLFALAPWCLMFGSPSLQRGSLRWGFLLVLTALAARLLWCGSVLAIACGFVALVAFAMTLAGRTPYVLGMIAYTGQSLAAGAHGLNQYGQSAHRDLQPFKTSAALSVVLPLTALLLFGTLFVMANPDLVSSLSSSLQIWLTSLREWLDHFSVLEVPFWIASAWVSVGLLRPLAESAADGRSAAVSNSQALPAVDAPLYGPFRNTLLTLIALFAAYLVFEFQTLWFREFPQGFHYSGYAHEGAAWLTIALGLATVTLSLIFRGQILQDARLPQLKRLAWVWSVLNLLLAAAVFHRLFIYVGFNGMTRMRMVGCFGTAAVVIGFLLAVYKIAKHRDFAWLFRADLWALVATVMAYAMTPVDLIVMRYNVARILGGDSAPSVQISVHPIDAEGVRELLPLLGCQDDIVRDGVRALCAQRWGGLPSSPATGLLTTSTWMDLAQLQLSEQLLVRDLQQSQSQWVAYLDAQEQTAAWERFRAYAYQWY